MKATPTLLILILTLFAACKKEDSADDKTIILTRVSGHVFGKYTHTPVAGTYIDFEGQTVHEPCFFCPDSNYVDLDVEVRTDSNGYYQAEISTTPEIKSIMAHCSACGSRYVFMGKENSDIDFAGLEYTVLKTTFQIINNTKPPLYVNNLRVDSLSKTFTDYKYADAHDVEFYVYYFLDNGIRKEHSDRVLTGAYIDTIATTFIVDPTTF